MPRKLFIGFLSGSLVGFAGHKLLTLDMKNERTRHPTKQTIEEQQISDILPYGRPDRFPDAAVYKNHILHYDQARKIPLWVAEHITANHVKGEANRRHSKFQPDPNVAEMFTAQNKDYLHSGWSRGHMAPAGDNKHDQDAMNHSFFLSNVLPQDLNNNSDFWNRMEIYCRDLTKVFDHVRIISGPLILPVVEQDGKKYIKHQVIGENEVAVPTHLYKVIVAENDKQQSPLLGCFVVPNEPIPRDHKLETYKVPLEYIERKSGFTFLSKLRRSDTRDLCTAHHCDLLGSQEFELYFITRKLQNSRTLHRLEKVWAELETKKLTPDEYTRNVYKRKRDDLLSKQVEENKTKEE